MAGASSQIGLTFQYTDLSVVPNPRVAWYALHTRSRHEKVVDRLLSDKGFETFIPLKRVRSPISFRRLREAELPLFPGYTFARFAAREHQHEIRQTFGVARIVADQEGPVSVPESEINALKRILAEGIDCRLSPFFIAGQRVVVRSGPLKGVAGEIVRSKKREVFAVKVHLLRRMLEMDFSSLDLELAPKGAM